VKLEGCGGAIPVYFSCLPGILLEEQAAILGYLTTLFQLHRLYCTQVDGKMMMNSQ